ncbi:MAG: hypothetical protein JXQ91_09565 [Vannielia sp.]|uniref:hypothetical protein n=1 Tax=Vannielia sp. TaxID=2813045 RepID=UPI003B8E4A12
MAKRSMTSRALLFSNSVIVTGTHYSMSTLMGALLGTSPDFNVVHEPLNHQPTLGYATVPTNGWYDYFDQARSADLASRLRAIQFGEGTVGASIRRLIRVRSSKDVLRCGKFAQTGMRHALRPRRAVFKDPFLCFSARHLQKGYGHYIVLTVRHPCGFAESLMRRGKGFDFRDLLQPALLDALPDLSDDICRFVKEPQTVLDQAALLWTIVNEFAARYYLDHPKSRFVRQEDLVGAPRETALSVFSALGAKEGSKLGAFLELNLKGTPRRTETTDADGKGSYIRRDGKKAATKWRERLDPSDIARVMARVGETAAHFGYTELGSVDLPKESRP